MTARNVLLGLAALFLALSIAAAAVPDADQAKAPENLPPGPAVVDPYTPGDGAARGVLPKDEVVRARVGQLVELTVTAPAPDSASVPGIGLLRAVDAGAPARFSFVADRPGVYGVKLALSDQIAGRVIVRR